MAVSKKIRFEVFKRDGFICRDCGKNPPDVKLEVDHIIPVSKGGSDDIDNLISSCFDCNRGKSNIELNLIPLSINENREAIIEREKEYLKHRKALDAIKKRQNKDIKRVEAIFRENFGNLNFTEKFKFSITKFINELNIFEVEDAMKIACFKFKGSKNYEDAISYFCGICWNKIHYKESRNER